MRFKFTDMQHAIRRVNLKLKLWSGRKDSRRIGFEAAALITMCSHCWLGMKSQASWLPEVLGDVEEQPGVAVKLTASCGQSSVRVGVHLPRWMLQAARGHMGNATGQCEGHQIGSEAGCITSRHTPRNWNIMLYYNCPCRACHGGRRAVNAATTATSNNAGACNENRGCAVSRGSSVSEKQSPASLR